MDYITPTQHDLVRRCFKLPFYRQPSQKLPSHHVAHRSPTLPVSNNPHRRSAIRAFWTLGVLNVPIAAFFTALAHDKVRHAESAWKRWSESTIPGRVLSYHLECVGFKQWFCRTRSSSMWQYVDMPKWAPWFGLRSNSLADGRYWTIFTSNFTHVHLGHFMGNMTGLWQFAAMCAEIPGLNSLHVFAIALAACLSSSVTSLFQLTYFPPIDNPWIASQVTALGFSGINMAFFGLAAACSPNKPMAGISIPMNVPCWTICGITMLIDLQGALHMMGLVERAPWAPKTGQPGHLAHLAGLATGALYYLLVMRPGTDLQSCNEPIADQLGESSVVPTAPPSLEETKGT